MKRLLGFFLLLRLLASQMCLQDEGCNTVAKKLTFVPVINSIGKEDSSAESFDFKVLKVFSNALSIYNSQDNSASLDTSQTINPVDLARRIPFSKIDLDCGTDGNKICMAYQFLEKFDRVAYKSSAVDGIAKLGGEFTKQCMILPIIDDSRTSLGENLVYICEENKDNLRTFFKFRDKLSRLIDAYHLSKLADSSFAVNSVPLKEDLLKTADSKGNMSSLLVKLDSRRIQGFLDPMNLNSKVFEIPLQALDLHTGVFSILAAIRSGLLDADWSHKLFPRPIEACCFGLLVKNAVNFSYFCVHYDNPAEFSSFQCERKIEVWMAKINNTAKRNQLELKGYLIRHKYKAKTSPQLDCRKIPELAVFRERVRNIGLFQDKSCEDLQAFTTTFQYSNCIADKKDDLDQEITLLKRYDSRIEDSLDQCLSKGFLDFGKVPISDKTVTSFLAINENNLGYKKKTYKNR